MAVATATPELFVPSTPNTEPDYISPDINAEIEAQSYAEQKNEIIALNEVDGKWKLDVGDAFQRQWQEIIDALKIPIDDDDENDRSSNDDDTLSLDDSIRLQDDKVFVISLLGNTSSGKSFIARHLFIDSQNNNAINGPVSIDEADKKGATTANVNCYVSQCVANSKTLVLDYEGEKGSAFPLFLYARRGWAHLTGSAEKAKQRRQAVTDYFPKLAYILSDVIILLGNDDFASTDYLTRCHEFALKANDGVSQISHRPLLIIIQNKSSLSQSVSSDIVTQKFFQIHGQEAQKLKLYFSDIKCYCLPHTEQLQRTKNGILDGREIFDVQMTDLKALFTSVREHISERIITHAQWLYLLHRVLETVQSGRTVSLHILLSEIIDHNDDHAIQTATRFFLLRYNQYSIHSPKCYANSYSFAVKILAHCLAVKAYGQRELMSERVIHEQCVNALELLSNKLDQFRPCEALYTGKGRSSMNKDNEHPVYCYQHKGAHEGGHRTCESVYGLSIWKELLGTPSTDIWPGNFVSSLDNKKNNSVLSENAANDLVRIVRELMNIFHQDTTAIYSRFTDLFCNCHHDDVREIFRRICFCAPSAQKYPILRQKSPVLRQQSTALEHKLKPRSGPITSMRNFFNRIFESRYSECICQKCYQELDDALITIHLDLHAQYTTSTFQSIGEQSECVICFCPERDFLFIPCGHRGFCGACAHMLLSQTSQCPICRTSITDKQRVHDV